MEASEEGPDGPGGTVVGGRSLTQGPSPLRTWLKIGLRIVVVVAALAIGGLALFNIFEDLDFDEIADALGRLSDAEWLAMGFAWVIWLGSQGFQTASLVRDLPTGRGVLAFLGPTAVAAVIPGPSDLPVRYSMYQSWGISNREAATAVAASGIFSVGSQLALPALSGIGILLGDVPLDGFVSIIVITTLALAVAVVVVAVALGSPRRTERLGRLLEPVSTAAHRLIRRPPPEELGSVLVDQRALVVDHLEGKWWPATGATILTIATRCSILVMALRFVGIPEKDLGWSAIFVVFGLVAGLTTVPITPGNAGVAEVALVGLLTPIAGSQYVNEVAAGVLLYRLLTWLLIIPVGLGVLAVWRVRYRSPSV